MTDHDKKEIQQALAILAAVFLVGLFTGRCSKGTPPPVSLEAKVYFSPNGGATQAVVEEIRRATKRIQMQAYSFTSRPIADALVAAEGRGVEVEAILDKSHLTATYSSAEELAQGGVEVTIDDDHAIAHSKIIIIDGKTVITGSFNFSEAAESRNAENLLVVENPELAEEYSRNWKQHRSHAEPYAGKRSKTN